MKCKTITLFSLILGFSLCMGLASANKREYTQQYGKPVPSGILEALGVLAPDGKRFVFPMDEQSAAKWKAQLPVYDELGNVKYVRTPDWSVFSNIAKSSVDDLQKAVANLLIRMGRLERRVDELEKKVK